MPETRGVGFWEAAAKSIKTQRRAADLACAAQHALLDEELKRLQEHCPHTKWRYRPDASGNNDDDHICEACGLCE